jgi:hypothetical protein
MRMSKDEATNRPTQNPETKAAQEIFVRDRGAQREVPLNEFLTHINGETQASVETERRERRRST